MPIWKQHISKRASLSLASGSFGQRCENWVTRVTRFCYFYSHLPIKNVVYAYILLQIFMLFACVALTLFAIFFKFVVFFSFCRFVSYFNCWLSNGQLQLCSPFTTFNEQETTLQSGKFFSIVQFSRIYYYIIFQNSLCDPAELFVKVVTSITTGCIPLKLFR